MPTPSQQWESRFEELLIPIRDLTKNWEVNIGKYIDLYLEHIHEGNENDPSSTNFAEAALLIQRSVHVYGRKVDHLYSLVLEAAQSTANSSRNEDHGSSPTKKSRSINKRNTTDDDCEIIIDMKKINMRNSELEESHPNWQPIIPEAFLVIDKVHKRKTQIISDANEKLGTIHDFGCMGYIDTHIGELIFGSMRFHTFENAEGLTARLNGQAENHIQDNCDEHDDIATEPMDLDEQLVNNSSDHPVNDIEPSHSCSVPQNGQKLLDPYEPWPEKDLVLRPRKPQKDDSMPSKIKMSAYDFLKQEKSKIFWKGKHRKIGEPRALSVVMRETIEKNFAAIQEFMHTKNGDTAPTNGHVDMEDADDNSLDDDGIPLQQNISVIGDRDDTHNVSQDISRCSEPSTATQQINDFIKTAAASIGTDEMTTRVQEWQKHMHGTLQKLDAKPSMDIREYGDKILDKFTELNTNILDFKSVVTSDEQEVSRYLLAALQLANTYNVEINGTKDDNSMDNLTLTINSRKRHYAELEPFEALSQVPAKKRKVRKDN